MNTAWKWLAHNTTFDRASDCSVLTSSHYRYTEPVSASSMLKQLLRCSVLQVMKFAAILCSQNQYLDCGFLFHFISCFINYTDYLLQTSQTCITSLLMHHTVTPSHPHCHTHTHPTPSQVRLVSRPPDHAGLPAG